MRQFINIVESSQSLQKYSVTLSVKKAGEEGEALLGVTVDAVDEKQATIMAIDKIDQRYSFPKEVNVEAIKLAGEEPSTKMPAPRKRTPRPKKVKPVIVNKSRLKGGRSIYPTPLGERWEEKGEPFLIDISELDLHPDGLGTAYGAFFWSDKAGEELYTKDTPVTVTLVGGQYHLLDGYHRVIKAHRHGHSQILCQEVI